MLPGLGAAAALGLGAVVCTLLLGYPGGEAAPAQAPASPSCQVQIGSAPPVPCGYIEHSDACCTEPLATRPIPSTQRSLASGLERPEWHPHSNVTFTALTDDALYLVSHDDGCGPAHECWEVSLGALGPLPQPAQEGATLEVSVAHLPGPKAYNVSLTTSTVFRGGPANASGPGPGQAAHRSASTEDCRLLRGSTPVLDIIGDDAAVWLVPPGAALSDQEAFVPRPGPALGAGPGAGPGVEAPALPPVCVTLHSDQCRVDCRDFTVPPQCRRTRFHQTVRCVEKPFVSVLTFRNVTRLNISRFNPGPGPGPGSAPHLPLLYHCARLQLGGCVVATPTVPVPLYPVPVRAEVVVPAQWATRVSTVALALASGGLLCVVVLLAARACWRGTGLSLLYPHLPGGGASSAPGPGAALRASLSRLSLDAPPSVKGVVSAAPATRSVMLVYCKDSGAERSAAFGGAVRVLGRMLGDGGRVEVTDMHDDPRLVEEGAVLRASTVLADEGMALVLVATPALAETLRPTTSLLELDIFHKFVTSLVLAFSHAPRCAVARLFTVCLDARHPPNFLIGIPVTAVFVMPYHVSDLLQAITGQIPLGKQFKADEQKLRKYINQLSPDPQSPVFTLPADTLAARPCFVLYRAMHRCDEQFYEVERDVHPQPEAPLIVRI